MKKGLTGIIGLGLLFNGVCIKTSWAQEKFENLLSNATTVKMKELVVTATRTETEVEYAPAITEIVNKKELEIKQPQTFDEAVEDLPGVVTKRGKGLMDTLASITVGGIPGQQRTLVMIDGIPINSPYYGGIKLAGLFPDFLSKIEVVEGPFSSLYGGYAMGGVVNFMTKMPEKREVDVKTGYGSSFKRGEAMDDLRKFYFSYGDRLFKKFSIFTSYGIHATNGYPTNPVEKSSPPPAGILGYENSYDKYGNPVYIYGDKGDNTWWDDSVVLKTQYQFKKDELVRLLFLRTRYEYDYDSPHTYLYNATTGQSVYYPSEYSYLAGSGGAIQNIFGTLIKTKLTRKLSLKITSAYLNTEKDWYIFPSYGATISGGPGKLSNTKQYRYYSDIQLTFPLFSSHLITFGGSFSKEHADTQEKNLSNWKDEDSTTTLRYESRGNTQNFAVFLQDEWNLKENLTIYMGIRNDWWKTYDGYVNQVGTAGYPLNYPSHSETCLSPKFAVVYQPFKKTVLKASVGKAFRPPTIYELYRTWTSAWSGTTYAGNPYLKPETTVSYNLGLFQRLWKGGEFQFSYFYNDLKDLIYSKTVNATYKEKINVGHAVTRGIIFTFKQKLNHNVKFFTNIIYTDSEIKENDAKPSTVGKRLTYTPLWRGNAGIEVKEKKFSFYVVGRYSSKYYGDDENRDKQSGVYGSYDEYFVVDTKFSYYINKHARVSFSINNLFDREYYQYYKAPGRSWFVEVALKF